MKKLHRLTNAELRERIISIAPDSNASFNNLIQRIDEEIASNKENKIGNIISHLWEFRDQLEFLWIPEEQRINGSRLEDFYKRGLITLLNNLKTIK